MDKELLDVSEFDAAEFFDSDEAIEAYLEETMSENDSRAFLRALNTVVRAKGLSQLSRETGIPRESLYLSLSEKGNPGFYTLWKVAVALGLVLTMRKKPTSHNKSKSPACAGSSSSHHITHCL